MRNIIVVELRRGNVSLHKNGIILSAVSKHTLSSINPQKHRGETGALHLWMMSPL